MPLLLTTYASHACILRLKCLELLDCVFLSCLFIHFCCVKLDLDALLSRFFSPLSQYDSWQSLIWICFTSGTKHTISLLQNAHFHTSVASSTDVWYALVCSCYGVAKLAPLAHVEICRQSPVSTHRAPFLLVLHFCTITQSHFVRYYLMLQTIVTSIADLANTGAIVSLTWLSQWTRFSFCFKIAITINPVITSTTITIGPHLTHRLNDLQSPKLPPIYVRSP